MLKAYMFETKRGVFRLLPETDGYVLMFGNERLAKAHDAPSALWQLFAGKSAFSAVEAREFGVPSTLDDWDAFDLRARST